MNLRIKAICKERKISVGDLANEIGIVKGSLSRIISNGNTSIGMLQKIADALDVPITELFERNNVSCVCPKCGAALRINVKLINAQE